MKENPLQILEDKIDSLSTKIDDILAYSMASFQPGTKDIGGIDIAIEETRLSKSTIYQLTSKGKMPHHKRGNRLYFSRDALRSWITSKS